MKKLLNPIEFYNDKKLLIVNLIIFAVGTFISIMMRGWFDHSFHLSFRTEINALKTFTENVLSVVLIAISIFTAGKIINKKTRIVDSLNLAFYTRIPFYLFSLSNFNGTFSNLTSQIIEKDAIQIQFPSSLTEITILIITSFLSLFIIVFQIISIYKCFKTLSNAKKVTHYLILAAFLIISMIISTMVFKNL